jgi:hypothetical protein
MLGRYFERAVAGLLNITITGRWPDNCSSERPSRPNGGLALICAALPPFLEGDPPARWPHRETIIVVLIILLVMVGQSTFEFIVALGLMLADRRPVQVRLPQ